MRSLPEVVVTTLNSLWFCSLGEAVGMPRESRVRCPYPSHCSSCKTLSIVARCSEERLLYSMNAKHFTVWPSELTYSTVTGVFARSIPSSRV